MADNGKIALVIGNGAYSHASTLVNPANDARDIAATLTRIGFRGISFDDAASARMDANNDIAPLLDLDFTGLRRALAAFARAAEDADQAVLYYAGHGIEVYGQNYLIPVDARLQHVRDVEFETSSMMQVLNAVGGEGASGLRLIILDACRDNPFRSRLFATRDLARGLRAIEPGRNILVAYAAKHGTVALDGDGRNSPYAKALIQHLEQPGLEIMDLFREVKDAVLESTGHLQEPYLYGSLGRRREYFVTPPVAAPQPVAKLPEFEPGTVEHAYWIEVKDSTDPEDLEQFIVQFPDGKFELLARRNIDRLISACSDKAVLLRLIARHPDSPSLALAHDRIASIAAGEQAAPTGKAAPVEQVKPVDRKEKRERPLAWPPRLAAEKIQKEFEDYFKPEPLPSAALAIVRVLADWRNRAAYSEADQQALLEALEKELYSRPDLRGAWQLLQDLEHQFRSKWPEPLGELSSRVIANLLLLFYSPSWRWVSAIGVCSAVLGALTFPASTFDSSNVDLGWAGISGGSISAGPVFAVALVLSLWLSGARDFWNLLILALGTNLIWPVAAATAIFTGMFTHSVIGIGVSSLLGGAVGGYVGAIAMSALVQRSIERKIDIRALITIGILGAIAGSLLIVDAKSASTPLKFYPWFCLAAWQVMILMTSSSVVSRCMRGAEWRRADWPPTRW